ncbi:MAG TPA: hypothetical protein VIY48_13195 [Candidatus Paceibacterota bacterium]
MKHHLRGDWLKWVAAGFALAATASAEYELARAIGMDKVIAAAVPGALDAYVVRALRAHREVLTAVLAMVGVNAASHLVTAGVLAVDWRLITAVSAIAPLVLWRVHALGTPGQWRARKIWGVPKHVAVPDPDGHASTPVTGCVLAHPECAGHDACTVYEKPSTDTFEEHASTALGVLDYVPREWVTPPVPEHIPDPVPGWDGTVTEHVPEKRERVLKAVPDLPDGYVHAGLRPGDDAYLEQARVLHARGTALRDWKPVLGVGTARAQRLRDYINAEHDASTEEST